jgi:hypothetical protein
MQMYYSTDGSSWLLPPSGFLSYWGPDNSNDGYNQSPGDSIRMEGVLPITIAPGDYIYLAWNYSVNSGSYTTNAQALAIDDVAIEAYAALVTDMPVFSPPSGYYNIPLNVTITTSTPGATIYYTTDGSEPTINSNRYDHTIALLASTTIKAIATTPGFANSLVSSATYYLPIEIPDLLTLRAQIVDNSTIYKVNGEVIITLISSVRNTKYVQDNTAAIMIEDELGVITTGFTLYNGFTNLTGKLNWIDGMLTLIPTRDPGAPTSLNNVVVPEIVNLAELNISHQAKLVKIIGADIATVPPTFIPLHSFALQDYAGTGALRTQYSDLNYIDIPVPTISQNITGVILETGRSLQIVPRSTADFAPSAATITINSNIPGAKIYRNGVLTAFRAPHVFNEHIDLTVTYSLQYLEPVIAPAPVTICIPCSSSLDLNYTFPENVIAGGGLLVTSAAR